MEEYISLVKDVLFEEQKGIKMKIYLETSVINFLLYHYRDTLSFY
ncbi:MAG: hypothetical protein ACTSR7_01265 [Promethearchaeota archaeon]